MMWKFGDDVNSAYYVILCVLALFCVVGGLASFTMDEALHIVVVFHKRIYPSRSWPSGMVSVDGQVHPSKSGDDVKVLW